MEGKLTGSKCVDLVAVLDWVQVQNGFVTPSPQSQTANIEGG